MSKVNQELEEDLTRKVAFLLSSRDFDGYFEMANSVVTFILEELDEELDYAWRYKDMMES